MSSSSDSDDNVQPQSKKLKKDWQTSSEYETASSSTSNESLISEIGTESDSTNSKSSSEIESSSPASASTSNSSINSNTDSDNTTTSPSKIKWSSLIHKGPVFAPKYESLPSNIHFKYKGTNYSLSPRTEEIAEFYARLLGHEYTTKEKFNTNFFNDWKSIMTAKERAHITDLKDCDFTEISQYYQNKAEERKNMSKEDKMKIKEDKEKVDNEYGYCTIDGKREKIANYRIEPPGLFRGRGIHPKMGKLKQRIQPEDVIINCSRNKIPSPPAGHRWKEIRHDPNFSWLASWTDNISKKNKYISLAATSNIKGEQDKIKYEVARKLGRHILNIRQVYTNDFKSNNVKTKQIAVAIYLIDKLSLRAGNEKNEDEEADTVGCCSLRCEHIKLINDEEYIVQFDFPGKDSIPYKNEVVVQKAVYNNLAEFLKNKKPESDLFDRINPTILNDHLKKLMEGLSAKVFRTYNASYTLEAQLEKLTPVSGTVAEKMFAYKRANREVAILCNHQRSIPKSHGKSVETLDNKITSKRNEVKKCMNELKGLKEGTKQHDKKNEGLKRLKQQLKMLKLNKKDKDEGKAIALGTSKLNYLDPRISVAWCNKYDVPIEKIYNKTQRDKFHWAIDAADEEFEF